MTPTSPSIDLDQPLLPEHPCRREFFDRLSGPEGCDFKPSGEWNCHGGGDLRFSRGVLTEMGFTERAITATLAHFRAEGVVCDCEIVLNLGSG